MAGKKLKQAIDFTCEIAQGSLVNRGVESLLDSLSGKHNSDFDIENMGSNFNLLMARAEDLDRETRIKEQQGGRKRKKEVEVWFEAVKNVEENFHAFKKEENGFMKQIWGGDEALKLNARIRDLLDRSRDFGELVVPNDNSTGLPRPTTELEGTAFRYNFERIWNLLENDQVSSIGVHGMGGVGKSTLVEHINNKLIQNDKFVFWVVVSSQVCSIKMLQDKIAHKLDLDLSKEDVDDVGARAGRLREALTRREKFVLILDDVWECFDLVKVGVPLSMEGCKWMMTSRSLKVCQQMKCQEKIVVKPLSKDEGWNLFLKNLGQDATSTLEDPEVEGIAKRMVKICDGLPLGIITLAGAVSGVTEIHEWRHELRVLEESAMGHEWMEEKVFKVLKYSFDRLTLNDQSCFLYCSLYPEDYHIHIEEELIKSLIREKLVDEKKSRGAQHNEGHSIVTRLVKVSLLESVGDGKNVKMHDLVRDMAHKITKGKTMVITGDKSRKEIPAEEEWTKDLGKVSLMKNGIKNIPDWISPNCLKLTTLLLQYNLFSEGISPSFFTRMYGLRTLNLSFTEIEELPDSVSDLVNLRSLLLQGCKYLQKVPSVRKLKELMELNLKGCTGIEDVPEGMEELVNMRYLSMEGADKLGRTSLEFRFPKIEFLSVPWNIQIELVQGWESLEVFTGRVNHSSGFSRLFASRQDDVSYSVVVGDTKLIGVFDSRKVIFGGRRELCVSGYGLKNREENELTSILVAGNIHHLKLESCEGMSKCLLDDLTNPASLDKLDIYSCGGIECLFKAAQHLKSQFQALREICLYNLDDFMGVIHKLEIQADAPPPSVFSSLRRLTIWGCKKMKNLGLPLSVIQKLEFISISECEEMEEIIQASDLSPSSLSSSLRCLSIFDCNKMKKLGLPIDQISEKLESMSIHGCDEIEEIIQVAATSAPPPLSLFSSLRWLTICSCKKMKKLRLPLSAFEKLESMSISLCEEMEEVIQIAATGPIYLPNLKRLFLIGLPSLKSFCDASVVFCNLLEYFKLMDCPRLEVPFLKWGTPGSYKPLFPGDKIQEIRRHDL